MNWRAELDKQVAEMAKGHEPHDFVTDRNEGVKYLSENPSCDICGIPVSEHSIIDKPRKLQGQR